MTLFETDDDLVSFLVCFLGHVTAILDGISTGSRRTVIIIMMMLIVIICSGGGGGGGGGD